MAGGEAERRLDAPEIQARQDTQPGSENDSNTQRVPGGFNITPAELRGLVADELLHNRCIEISEQHQLAWCIAHWARIRLDSIGFPNNYGRTRPLTWRNVTFSRDERAGAFTCVIKFGKVATEISEDPERPLVQLSKPLALRFPSPTGTSIHSITLSVPHRLLVIALRRSLLVGIHTVQELMEGNQVDIVLKEEVLDHPLFYQGRPEGDGLDVPHPLTGEQLTGFLISRMSLLGMSPDHHMA